MSSHVNPDSNVTHTLVLSSTTNNEPTRSIWLPCTMQPCLRRTKILTLKVFTPWRSNYWLHRLKIRPRIWSTKFWTLGRPNFRTFGVIPCERNAQTHEFSTGQKFVRYCVNVALVSSMQITPKRKYKVSKSGKSRRWLTLWRQMIHLYFYQSFNENPSGLKKGSLKADVPCKTK